jgi:hypothetical protein
VRNSSLRAVFTRTRLWLLLWIIWIQSEPIIIFFLKYVLILSPHIRKGVRSSLFPLGFLTKILVTIFPPHSVLLYMMFLIFGEEYKSWRSPLRDFLHTLLQYVVVRYRPLHAAATQFLCRFRVTIWAGAIIFPRRVIEHNWAWNMLQPSGQATAVSAWSAATFWIKMCFCSKHVKFAAIFDVLRHLCGLKQVWYYTQCTVKSVSIWIHSNFQMQVK